MEGGRESYTEVSVGSWGSREGSDNAHAKLECVVSPMKYDQRVTHQDSTLTSRGNNLENFQKLSQSEARAVGRTLVFRKLPKWSEGVARMENPCVGT